MADVRALIVGAGAIGNEVIKNLALLGVGHVLIVDRDRIEASNLTRSVLFCTPDIAAHVRLGTPKAQFAATRVRDINPDVHARAVVSEVGDLGLGHVRRADVVFGCLDNEMARLELSWICARADRLLVDGGLGNMNPSSGAVAVFPGAQGPCYACRKSGQRRRELLWDLQGREDPCWRREADAFVSTTPLLASIVGALQVELGLRACLDPPAGREVGRFIRVALHPALEIWCRSFERSPACPLHDAASVAREVVERPDRRSDQWSVVDMLRDCGHPDGVLTLDWPLTVRARCGSCGHEWEPRVRRARFRRASCPGCGGQELAELEVLTEVAATSPWALRSLADLGLPRGHVHEIAAPGTGDGRRTHVEITGDLTDDRVEAAQC